MYKHFLNVYLLVLKMKRKKKQLLNSPAVNLYLRNLHNFQLLMWSIALRMHVAITQAVLSRRFLMLFLFIFIRCRRHNIHIHNLMFGDEWQSPFLVIRLQARKKSTESCMGNEHLFSSTPPVCAFLAG